MSEHLPSIKFGSTVQQQLDRLAEIKQAVNPDVQHSTTCALLVRNADCDCRPERKP